jgi:hypothetical protein
VRELFELMAAQHGVASVAQARAVGVTRRVERRLLRDGVVRALRPGVLAAAGAPPTFHARALAATLRPDVVAVSHGAAARLHGLAGFADHATVDVVAGPGARPAAGGGTVVHRTRAPTGGHVATRDGIPVLTVAATFALLAPAAGIDVTAAALDDALAAGLTSREELWAVASAWRGRGRAGPAALLRLLREPARR